MGIRLSEEDKRYFTRIARERDFGSVSEYLRASGYSSERFFDELVFTNALDKRLSSSTADLYSLKLALEQDLGLELDPQSTDAPTAEIASALLQLERQLACVCDEVAKVRPKRFPTSDDALDPGEA